MSDELYYLRRKAIRQLEADNARLRALLQAASWYVRKFPDARDLMFEISDILDGEKGDTK